MIPVKRQLAIVAVIWIASCLYTVSGQIRVAVSKTGATYELWLSGSGMDVIPVNMYGLRPDSALRMLQTCSGLLLTGGEDVYPGNYGMAGEIDRCEDIDYYRDTLELALIVKAVQLNMPVFGICRGEQILNVALGGSLYVDIPTDAGTSVVHRCTPGSDRCMHAVRVKRSTQLHKVLGVVRDSVNSYHHQAVRIVAPGMKVAAVSEDGIAEAIEPIRKRKHPMVMGVQWHPEKSDSHQEMSKPLVIHFLHEVEKYNVRE
jgi:putative glutamine amidotransferase